MDVELVTALTGMLGGGLAILQRKFSVRTFIETFHDPSEALDPRLQEDMMLAVGLLMMLIGCSALIVWLV